MVTPRRPTPRRLIPKQTNAPRADRRTPTLLTRRLPTEPAAPAASADDIPDEMTSTDGKYQVAFITDVGQLKDKSFNQGTYDGVKLYANAAGQSYKYYQPSGGDSATDDDRYNAMKLAADNGAEVIVAAGFMRGHCSDAGCDRVHQREVHLHRRLGTERR